MSKFSRLYSHLRRQLSRAIDILPYFVLLSFALAVHAQNPSQATSSESTLTLEQSIEQLRDRLDKIRHELQQQPDSERLKRLRDEALSNQDQANQLSISLKPQLTNLQLRLDVLGPAPAKGAAPENADIAMQRRYLAKERAALEAQFKQAELMAEEGLQLATQATVLRRDQFQEQLTTRTASPFTLDFWQEPTSALPDDMKRLRRYGSRIGETLQESWQPSGRLPLLLGLSGAVLLFALGRWFLLNILRRLIVQVLPAGHLRRSLLAFGMAAGTVLIVGGALELLYLAANWTQWSDTEVDELARNLLQMTLPAAWLGGLGSALLSVRRPSWRLLHLTQEAAAQLRPFPWLLAFAKLLLDVLDRFHAEIGASLSGIVVIRAIGALIISGILSLAFWRLSHVRRHMQASAHLPAPRPLWVGLLAGGAILGIACSLLALACGYIAMAYFLAKQVLWVGTVVFTTILCSQLLCDLFDALLTPEGRSGRRLKDMFELSSRTLGQSAIIISGLTRVTCLLLAIAFIVAPFGATPHELLGQIPRLFAGLQLGQLTIHPGALLNAVLVFVVGLLAIRTFKRWLKKQLLPKTSLDPGMQHSMVTLLGYAGAVLVFSLALASLNVSLQSITWIASALTLGIGFSLQDIVKNFISGLILLAERPVKVGDWVSLSGVEGDIRRISVRATEIQQWDHSTVIVPNSQLITQNVRNVTLGHALGRVQIKLPLPLHCDPAQIHELLLEVIKAHPAVLGMPEPYVRLADVDAQSMLFNCVGYVASARDSDQVKSDLLFAMFAKLNALGLSLHRPHNLLLHPSAISPAKD